jgi:nucleotide-binding universal stress UspA family protein
VCAVGDDGADGGAANVVSFLEAHGHAARLVAEPRHERTDSDAILDVVERVGGTLIVAGAYGQSRFKEWAFGGVTRDLLDHTTVTCLLSH